MASIQPTACQPRSPVNPRASLSIPVDRQHLPLTSQIEHLQDVAEVFRDLTTGRLRRSVFTSVPQLVAAINEYVAHRNTARKPFIRTKSARDILQKVIRANSRLSSKQNGTLHQVFFEMKIAGSIQRAVERITARIGNIC